MGPVYEFPSLDAQASFYSFEAVHLNILCRAFKRESPGCPFFEEAHKVWSLCQQHSHHLRTGEKCSLKLQCKPAESEADLISPLGYFNVAHFPFTPCVKATHSHMESLSYEQLNSILHLF
jgi:hypothetical protein